MEHLMNELIGRSIAREREHQLALEMSQRRPVWARLRRDQDRRPPRRPGAPLVLARS